MYILNKYLKITKTFIIFFRNVIIQMKLYPKNYDAKDVIFMLYYIINISKICNMRSNTSIKN